jgi:hypothetical protein
MSGPVRNVHGGSPVYIAPSSNQPNLNQVQRPVNRVTPQPARGNVAPTTATVHNPRTRTVQTITTIPVLQPGPHQQVGTRK